MDPIERLRFLALGTGAREGGEKTQTLQSLPFPPRYMILHWKLNSSVCGHSRCEIGLEVVA